MESRPILKFKNVYPVPSPKPVYTNIKTDALSKTRLKVSNGHAFVPSGQHAIVALPLDKENNSDRITLNHSGTINVFNSSHHQNVIASSCRQDAIIRIWDLDSQNLEVPAISLNGHGGKIEDLNFHPIFPDIFASSATDASLRLWSLHSSKNEISLTTDNDAHVQSFSFDYLGSYIASITSESCLLLHDPRTKSRPVHKVETFHSKAKSARVCWLHPDPLIITTGFDKSSDRTLCLWDIRRLDKSLSETSFGSSFAQLEPVWDSELPILYLPARNENLNIMELTHGELLHTASAKIEKKASCLVILQKSRCNTSKCEIARFLRLGSDQSIDTIGIHVPRLNSDIVFQHDLYPNYSCPVVKDSKVWFEKYGDEANDKLESLLVMENPRVSSLGPTIRSEVSKKKDSNDESLLLGNKIFEAFVEFQNANNNWKSARMELRKNLYIFDMQYTPIFVTSPGKLCSFVSYDDESNIVFLESQNMEISVRFPDDFQTVEFINIICLCSYDKSFFADEILEGVFKVFDPYENYQDFRYWPTRKVILEQDAMITIYNSGYGECGEHMLLKTVDLKDLLGIFRVFVECTPCPSARFDYLPISLFRLVFVKHHYYICARSEKELELWIYSIIRQVETFDFHPRGFLIYSSNQNIDISLLKLTHPCNIQLHQDDNIFLLLLYDVIQFCKRGFDQNPVCLSISISSVIKYDIIDGETFWLTFGDNQTIYFQVKKKSDIELITALFKKFMCRNIPGKLGIDSVADLKLMMNESVQGIDIEFYPCDKSQDSKTMRMIGFSDCGELQAFKPNYMSVFGNYAYVLETENEIYHWKGPNCKRRTHSIALDMAVRIRKYRNLRQKVVLVDNDDPYTMRMLCSLLGSSDAIPTSDGPQIVKIDAKCYQVNAAAKHILQTLIQVEESNRLSKNILNSNNVYICTLQNIVLLWIGNASTQSDRDLGRAFAVRMAKRKYGSFQAIFECLENLEHPVFWKAFNIDRQLPISMLAEDVHGNIAKTIEQKEIDVEIFQQPLIFDTKGSKDKMVNLSIFRIVDFSQVKIKSQPLLFHSSCSYLLLYFYNTMQSGVTKAIAFFWQGSKSAIIEKGATAMLTIEASRGFDGEISQVREEEGKESIQFCRILGGINIVDTPLDKGLTFPTILDVRALSPDHPCKSYQITNFQQIPWHPNHVLLILMADSAIIWRGKFALQSEIEYAKELSLKFGITSIRFYSNMEDKDLCILSLLKANKPINSNRPSRFSARFFQASSVTGCVQISPLNSMNQTDLKILTILDNLETIYIWVHESSKPSEVCIVIKTVQRLISSNPVYHQAKCIVTYQDREPFDFKIQFHGWRSSGTKTEEQISGETYLQELEFKTYPISALLSEPPEHLDRTRLESYLDHESFIRLFQMTKEEYEILPIWKRNNLKKSVGFF